MNNRDENKGLLRSVLQQPDVSITDTFTQLESFAHPDLIIQNKARDLFSVRINLDEKEGKGRWDIVKIRNEMFIVICDFTYVDPRYERIRGDDFVELQIKLSGHLMLTVDDKNHIEVSGPSLLVWNQGKETEMEEWVESNSEEKSVTIFCNPAYLMDMMSPSDNHYKSELSKILSKKNNQVLYCCLPVNQQILQCANDIIYANNHYDQTTWLSYIEAKSLELICMFISNFKNLSDAADITFKDSDIKRFHEVKNIVSKTFDPPPTLSSLAKEVGMNSTKLKFGFKSLFGMTVFEYGHRCRMQHAMELLKRNVHVNVVAWEVGYKHHTTFATAFKSHFGCRPKDVRKLR